MILKNPQIAPENMAFLLILLSGINQDSTELHQLASQIISTGSDYYAAFYEKLPPNIKQALTQNFGITF